MLAHEVRNERALRHYTQSCRIAHLVEGCLHQSRPESVLFTVRSYFRVRENNGVPELPVGRKTGDFPIHDYLKPASVLVVPHLNISHQISLIRLTEIEASRAKRTTDPERAGKWRRRGGGA